MEQFVNGLRAYSQLAIVAIVDAKLGLQANSVPISEVNQVFAAGVEVLEQDCPSEFLPFTSDSFTNQDEVVECAEALINSLVEIMHDSQLARNVLLERILSGVFHSGLWDCLGPEERKAISRKARVLMREICRTEMKDWFQEKGGTGRSPAAYEIVDSPLTYTATRRTQKLQVLQRAKQAFLERKRKGEGFSGYNPNQRELFDSKDEA